MNKSLNPSLFTKGNRQKLINDLLETATAILLRRDGKVEFKKIFVDRNLKQIRVGGFCIFVSESNQLGRTYTDRTGRILLLEG